MKQADLAERAGTTQPTVSRWLKGSVPEAPVQEKLLEIEREKLGLDDPDENWVVRVVGQIGAGAAIDPDAEQVPDDGLWQIRAPFPVPAGSLAFCVSGDSMRPRYESGDIVICWRQAPDPSDVLGKEAVVQTVEGKRYLKIVRRGSTKRLFDLESHNASMLHGVKVQWAARVGAIIKAEEVEMVRRSASPKKSSAKRVE